jgi:hypothetical protein
MGKARKPLRTTASGAEEPHRQLPCLPRLIILVFLFEFIWQLVKPQAVKTRPTNVQHSNNLATPGAHKPKGQSTHGASNHVPKQKVSAHRSTRTAHRDTARPVIQPNKARDPTHAPPRTSTHTPLCRTHPRVPYTHAVPQLRRSPPAHSSAEPNTRSTTTHVPPGTSSLQAPSCTKATNEPMIEASALCRGAHSCAIARAQRGLSCSPSHGCV